jgi:hypothetical protein
LPPDENDANAAPDAQAPAPHEPTDAARGEPEELDAEHDGGFVPEPFGKYWLVQPIAVGGMAEIFRAKTFGHGGFENLIVIKRILAELGEDPQFVSMFVEEAKVGATLQHPNVVRIWDFGKEHENWFIAMEHVNGRDLRRTLAELARRQLRLPVELAVYVVAEVCKALHYAHTRTDAAGNALGLVHRDVSPSNVLVDWDGRVKLADFGIALAGRRLQEAGSDRVIAGKPEYMSPEQANGDPLDARSDVFSCGIVMWELLTGRRAFRSPDEAEALRRVRNVELPTPRTLDPSIPEAVEEAVMRALHPSLDHRFATAQDMHDALIPLVRPSSSEELRLRLASFLEELFTEERAADQTDLDLASRVAFAAWQEEREAEEARQTAPPVADPVAAPAPPAPSGPRWRFIAVGSLLGALAIASLGVIWAELNRPPPEPLRLPEAGSIAFTLAPSARVYVDDVLYGESASLTVPDLLPGQHTVRLEVDGRPSITETVAVTAGGATHLRREIPEGVVAPPEPEPAEPVITPPAPERQERAERTERTERREPKPPPPDAGGEGSLTVVVSGGWANVYVDGAKISKTAPFSGYKLSTGKHQIRVVNEALGLDHSQVIDVSSGGTARVVARP